MPSQSYISCLLWAISVTLGSATTDENLPKGRRFGEGFKYLPVLEMKAFPNAIDFINNYIKNKVPLVVRGGARISPAFSKWSDEYFLSVEMPEDAYVHIETMKKENRSQPTEYLHFHEFIRAYNNSELYMVDNVPEQLRADITIPCPLHSMAFVESIMWYSSGGTKSVVHTDSVDNLNCLYSGRKKFILINPKDATRVDMDGTGASHSSVDVDNVDYTKYPGLAEVDYYNASLDAGDCLYIPYLWIHQVTSYGHNLAVNLWWDHYLALLSNGSDVNNCAENMTLRDVKMQAFNSILWSTDIFKDRFKAIIGVKDHGTLEDFKNKLVSLNDIRTTEGKQSAEDLVEQMFTRLDANRDDKIHRDEVDLFDDWAWMKNIFESLQKIMGQGEEEDSDDSDTAEMPSGSIPEDGRTVVGGQEQSDRDEL